MSDREMVPLVKVLMPERDVLMPRLEQVLYSGMIAEGVHVQEFEARCRDTFGLPNALAISSGTGALHIALLLAGVRPGDEVISTSMTAEPTNTTILQVGAEPVFADVDPQTGNLDPASVEAMITPRTRAICVVHYAGYPADLTAVRRIADTHGLKLIEDCAHALGARYADQPIGTLGDFSIFSFQAIKHMTTVDGGLLTLRDENLLPEARRLRWFGLTKGVPRTEVDLVRPGFKYNMSNVAAVIGNAQLDIIGDRIERHKENGRFFDQHLSDVGGVAPARVDQASEPSYWLYTLLADDSDAVERKLASIGVMASKLHRPNHLHTAFNGCRRSDEGLTTFYHRLVHVPCGWWVSDEVRNQIVDTLKAG
jgi:perosamine synthetase